MSEGMFLFKIKGLITVKNYYRYVVNYNLIKRFLNELKEIQ